jgi:3',5'-cyclic AMP phosphodiesterase CpdA
MGTFNAARKDYDPRLDVRGDYHDSLAERLQGSRPNGPIWLLLAARRMGKSWTLQGVQHRLGVQKGTVLDLGGDGGKILDGDPPSLHLLLDEPGRRLEAPAVAAAFIERCAELRQRGITILLALSPAEWFLLRQADQLRQWLDEKDLLPPLEPLTAAQARHLAKRQPWAKALLQQLPEEDPWRRTPFLLEHLLEVAEGKPRLRTNLPALRRTAIDQAADPNRYYWKAVYVNGLAESQQAAVRAVARSLPADAEVCELLCRSGVLTKSGKRYVLTDPVLCDRLPPPLRIHHISDIHVGPRTADATDVKLKDTIGHVLGEATGAGPVHGTYVHHIQGLAGSGTRPHLLVVSGDVAEWATAKQYQEFAEWFKGLQVLLAPHPHLNGDDPRVLFVGGNHDVDWSRVLGTAGARDRHRPFAEAFKDFPHPHLEKAPDKRRAEDAVVAYPGLGILFLLLGSAEFGGEVMTGKDPEQADLLKRINELREELLKAATKDGAREKEVSELLKRLARIDPGLVHKQDLVRAREFVRPDHEPVRIAVLHHPLSPLPVTEINHFVGLLNAGEVKQALFEMKFCLALHGHLHMGWFACEQWPETYGDWVLRTAAAPTLASTEKSERHGFNEVEVVREGNRFEVTVRRFVRKGHNWVEEDKHLGPFEPGQWGSKGSAKPSLAPPV